MYPNRCLITPAQTVAKDEIFSVEKWLADSLGVGIRSVGSDPLMRPYLNGPKAEETLFGKTFKVYHVLGTAKCEQE